MKRRALLFGAMVLTVGACGGSESGDRAAVDSAAVAPAAPQGDVERAVAVYRGVEAEPAAAESVLAAHGLTQEGLDSLMYRIASDSALSAEYRAAIQ